MVTSALLFRPSAMPLERGFLSAEIVEDQLAELTKDRAIFFMGAMRECMVWRHRSSRNFAAQAGEL